MDKEYKGYKIEGVGKGKADYYVYTDLCKGCGLCIAKCPMNKAGKKMSAMVKGSWFVPDSCGCARP